MFVAQKSVVPQLTLLASPKPRNSSAASKKTAWMKMNANPAAMRLSMFGISSSKTIRKVDSPVTLAAWMKSRPCIESACPRRIRVSIAQLVSPMITAITHGPVWFMNDEITIRSGSIGMTRKMLARRLIASSMTPPQYAATARA